MDQEMKSEWETAIDTLMNIDPDRRRHFALLLVSLVTVVITCRLVMLCLALLFMRQQSL